MADKKNGVAFTEAEAELYDRQIRLWGLDAQKRLRASRILLIGVKGIGAEICKNLVLSGVKSLTMVDPGSVTEEDFISQFLVARESLGKNRAEASLQRAQQLNPMVTVTADSDDISNKPDDFLLNFDVVVATGCSAKVLIKLDETCSANSIMFYAADVFGFYGYMFANLGKHRFVEEERKTFKAGKGHKEDDEEPASKKKKMDQNDTAMVEKFSEFSCLQSALSCKYGENTPMKTLKRLSSVYFIVQVLFRFNEKHGRPPKAETATEDKEELSRLRESVMEELKINKDMINEEFSSHCFSELSPVCAVVGGVVGQEIVKAVSGKDAPFNNFFFYDGQEGHGMVECFT